MPDSKFPQHVVDQAVKRYLAGESAAVLAKFYKVSKPGLYLWIQRYKRDLLAKSDKREGIDPEESSVRVMQIELEALRRENKKLRDRVVDMMVKYE